MKAICLKQVNELEVKNVPRPESAKSEHLIIKINSCAINDGDKAWISGIFPPNFAPESQYNIAGVSASGTVLGIGTNVSKEYLGKKVAIYRSLKFSKNMIGTWSEFAEMHPNHCAILPDNAELEAYSGSLVNVITPYVFLKQAQKEGHNGIICTAGTSATGRAMLGVCLANNIPIISIVRKNSSIKILENLDAKNIISQDDPEFEAKLEKLSNELKTTAVFDGIGGNLMSKIILHLPHNSTIYHYGFLGGNENLSFHTSTILMKGLNIKSFGILANETVKNSEKLKLILKEISKIIYKPHFKTKIGKKFQLEEFEKAMKYTSNDGGKAIFTCT